MKKFDVVLTIRAVKVANGDCPPDILPVQVIAEDREQAIMKAGFRLCEMGGRMDLWTVGEVTELVPGR